MENENRQLLIQIKQQEQKLKQNDEKISQKSIALANNPIAKYEENKKNFEINSQKLIKEFKERKDKEIENALKLFKQKKDIKTGNKIKDIIFRAENERIFKIKRLKEEYRMKIEKEPKKLKGYNELNLLSYNKYPPNCYIATDSRVRRE